MVPDGYLSDNEGIDEDEIGSGKQEENLDPQQLEEKKMRLHKEAKVFLSINVELTSLSSDILPRWVKKRLSMLHLLALYTT